MTNESAIRIASLYDAEGIREIYDPIVRDTPISFELETPSAAEIASRIDRTLKRYPWLVLEREGRILGYAYGGAYRARPAYQWSAEVSVYVHTDARRGGVGRKLYGKLFELLRRQNFFNAYAGVTLPNPASVGLHESLGFEPIGAYRHAGFKAGAWHDVGWWQLALQDPVPDPTPPVPLPELLATS